MCAVVHLDEHELAFLLPRKSNQNELAPVSKVASIQPEQKRAALSWTYTATDRKKGRNKGERITHKSQFSECHAKGMSMIQLLSTNGLNGWTPDRVMGKIMVCMDGASDADGILLQNAGGGWRWRPWTSEGRPTPDAVLWWTGGGSRRWSRRRPQWSEAEPLARGGWRGPAADPWRAALQGARAGRVTAKGRSSRIPEWRVRPVRRGRAGGRRPSSSASARRSAAGSGCLLG